MRTLLTTATCDDQGGAVCAYVGQVVELRFEMGSDDFNTEAGWYIAAIRVGSDQAVPAKSQSLGEIKARF